MGELDFQGLFITLDEADRLRSPLASAGRLLAARPHSVAILVEFETFTDEDEVVRARHIWHLIDAAGGRAEPETDLIEPPLWRHCWAIQRFAWAFFLGELLDRSRLGASRPDGRPARFFARFARMGLLLWPEAVVLLDDVLPLLIHADLPHGTLRPLVSERDRENYMTAATLLQRLGSVFPGLTPAVIAGRN